MKITPSSCVLVAELFTIFLFHLVKIKQAEKHPAETVLSHTVKVKPLPKTDTDNKSGFEYMLVSLIK
jgi:hypothetical protein